MQGDDWHTDAVGYDAIAHAVARDQVTRGLMMRRTRPAHFAVRLFPTRSDGGSRPGELLRRESP
jgi:hypothetical protein